jgi:tetratricopeptide (TPR) repeat protein
VLSAVKSDSGRVNLYNELSNEFNLNEQIDSSYASATRAKELSQKINFQPGLAKAYTHLGLYYQKSGNLPEAIHHYFEGAKLWEVIGGKGRHALVAYANIGALYNSQQNYDEALKFWNIALKISRSLNDKESEANCYKFIGDIYVSQKKTELALDNFEQYRKNALELKNNFFLSDSYVLTGKALEQKGDYRAALQQHFKAMQLVMESGDRRAVAEVHTDIGDDYFKQDILDSALIYYSSALYIVEQDQNEFAVAFCYSKIIKIYNKQKKYKEAIQMGESALAMANEMKAWQLIADINEDLSETYSATNDAAKAISYYKAAMVGRDSVRNETGKRKSLQMAMQFEYEKKEAAASLLQSQKDEAAAKEREHQRIIMWTVSGLLLLAVVFTIFILKSNRQRRLANLQLHEKNRIIEQQKEEVEIRQKEILDSIHYARRIQQSLLPTEKYLNKTLSSKKAGNK